MAVITFLVNITQIVNALIDMGDPLHAGNSYLAEKDKSLASFELYKAETMKNLKTEGGASQSQSYIPDDKTLQAMYSTARQEKINSEMHQIRRELIVNKLLIVISILLFITHWRWVRKIVAAG